MGPHGAAALHAAQSAASKEGDTSMSEFGILFLIFAGIGFVLVAGGIWGDNMDRRDAKRRNRR